MSQKPLTEQELRLAWKDGAPESLAVPPGTPVTPAAREYLRQRRVELLFANAAPPNPASSAAAPPAAERPARTFLGPDGGIFDHKPEALTHLRGRQLVRKDHPVIVWRGRLDSFCARIIEAQGVAVRESRPELAEELQEILDFCRRLLRSELREEEAEDFRLLGLTPGDLRERSHNPVKFFGHPHLQISYRMGPLAAALNILRTEVREVETAAAAAFGGTAAGRPRRDDLILALNRLSSLFYIMIFRYLPAGFQPEPAGI